MDAEVDTMGKAEGLISLPPNVADDITHAFSWLAEVSRYAGLPDYAECEASQHHIYVTLPNEDVLTMWAYAAGATLAGTRADALGAVRLARTDDSSRWKVFLEAIITPSWFSAAGDRS